MSGVLPYLSIFGLIGTIATAVAVVVKLGPQKTSIEIENADKIILRERNWSTSLAERLDDYSNKYAETQQRLESCESKNSEMKDKLARLEQRLDELANKQ